MANKTVGNGVGPVYSRNNANHQNQFIPQVVLLRTGNVNITPARPQSVHIGKPKVPAPIPTGRQNRPIPVPTSRQNRPIPVPTDRGDSPSVTFGWWQSTTRPMPHLNRPTSSYFQTYTPYVPQMYYNHMLYGGVRWATTVKPSTGCSWKTHRKGVYWENPYSDAEDEGIFDSGCSRSMTYPKESPFVLEAYSDSDYAGANKDRKSTTGGCQFLGRRLISLQCKKQTIVTTSSTEAEYVAAANCCGQYCCCTIRHHFIRDANEKKLIQVLKIHTDDNVAD
ncbi:hypothetical protein Tco_1567097 [Tanacetum coccineum]